jgi:phasin
MGALELAPLAAIFRHPTSALGVAPGSPQQEALKGSFIMDMKTKATATQPTQAYEKISAATAEATDLIKVSYSTAVKGVQDYNNKLLEFAQANTNAAFEFAQRLPGVKSPSEFVELSTERARKQLETLTEQTKELAALAQKVSLATTEPLKAGMTKAFSHSS